jgi:hypothetical protein
LACRSGAFFPTFPRLPISRLIAAANDDEAIAQAEVVRGSFAAEILDIEGLRIVKYLPSTGRRQK